MKRADFGQPVPGTKEDEGDVLGGVAKKVTDDFVKETGHGRASSSNSII
jgi:hypothetical protein